MKRYCLILILLLVPTPSWAAIAFNGTNQNVHQGTGFTLGLSSQKTLTMAAWVTINGAGSSQDKIYGKSTAVGGNQTFNFGVQDCGLLNGSSSTNTLCLSMGQDNNSQNTFIVSAMNTSSFPLQATYFVAIVWNNTSGNSSDWTMYIGTPKVNGVNGTLTQVSSGSVAILTNVGAGYSTSTTIEDLASNLYIGSACGGTCPSEWLPGVVGEIYASLSALNSTQIATLFNNGISDPCHKNWLNTGSPILYMPLDDYIGGTIIGTPKNLGSKAFTAEQQAGTPSWSTNFECSISGKTLSGNTAISGTTN